MTDDIKKMMPPPPEFEVMRAGLFAGCLFISKYKFNAWYDQHIVPLFTNAKVVHGNDEDGWTPNYEGWGMYKALLINIQPIKEETAEDVLKEVIRTWEKDKCRPNEPLYVQMIKAKAFFKKNDKQEADNE